MTVAMMGMTVISVMIVRREKPSFWVRSRFLVKNLFIRLWVRRGDPFG